MESMPVGTCKVWSLYRGGLYIQVVFRAGLTVYISLPELLHAACSHRDPELERDVEGKPDANGSS